MPRVLLLLAVGAAVGYVYGFRDARAHDRNVVERILDRAGGSARGKYNPDVDGGADAAVGASTAGDAGRR